MAHVLRRFSIRRAWDAGLDWIDDHDLARPLLVIAGLFVGGALVVLAMLGGREQVAPIPQTTPDRETRLSTVVNQVGGYGFSVPGTWAVKEDEMRTRVASANGRIVITFDLGTSGEIEQTSARLLDSLLESQTDQQLIGSSWERIGGSRSLLVSGTAADETGRSVRFLAITVRGDPRNYAITLSVPARSDPARVLLRLERIVTSFQILESYAATSQ